VAIEASAVVAGVAAAIVATVVTVVEVAVVAVALAPRRTARASGFRSPNLGVW